jgi:glycerophosphoryl diester phosphodiesterase
MNHPLIIAHRARTSRGFENARSWLELVAAEGADLIELDVRLTLDRKLVIVHDALPGRTTTGHGPAAPWPSRLPQWMPLRRSESRQPVPLLRSVLQIAPATAQVALHVRSRGAMTAVMRTIRKHGDPSRTWLWLERMEDIFTATRELPEIRCALLRPAAWTAGRRSEYFHDAQASGARVVSVPSGAVSPELVHHAHQHHLYVFSRIDRADLLPDLVGNGLDGAITTEVTRAVAILHSMGLR